MMKRLALAVATLLAMAQPCAAAGAFVQGFVATAGTGNTSCTFTSPTVGNDALVMFVAAGTDTVNANGVTDDANGGSNTYTITNTAYTQSTLLKGGWAVAHIAARNLSNNLIINVAWSGSNSHHTICAEVSGLTTCAGGACVDTGSNGIGCASAAACNTTGIPWTAQQNNEIVFSFLENNAAVSAQASADTGVCKNGDATPSPCPVAWPAGTTRDFAYYRSITSGGSQSCSWTWTTNTVSGVSCIGLKSAVVATSSPGQMMMGVGDTAWKSIEENQR
jgi:hypothetical protein